MRRNLFFLVLFSGFYLSLSAQSQEYAEGILLPVKALEEDFPMEKVHAPKGHKTNFDLDVLKQVDACYKAKFTPEMMAKAKTYANYYTREQTKVFSVMKGLQQLHEEELEKVLGLKGLPNCLKYLPMAMAANNRRFVNTNGRVGLWQLTYPVAIKYGLVVNEDIDERRDVQKSTLAAAAYLKDLYHLFETHDMVLMAFCCGPAVVNRAVIRSNDKRDYAALYEYLPAFSRDYILAYTVLLYLSEYEGKDKIPAFKILDVPEADKVNVEKRVSMLPVSKVLGLPVSQIKAMNPVYRSNYIPATTDYPLFLPKGYKAKFEKEKDTLYKVQERLDKPKPKPVYTPPKPKPVPTAKVPTSSEKLVYSVKPGDNLSYISQWYDVRVSQLKGWNKLRSDRIDVGQQLTVYVPSSQVGKYKKVNSMSHDAKMTMIGKDPSKPEPQPTSTGDWEMYTVKKGDTLWSISRKYNCTTAEIMKWNNIGESIDVGQVLKIKK